MWSIENRTAFFECVADLLKEPKVQKMQEIRQHVEDANCLQHCLFVAYLSFLFLPEISFGCRFCGAGRVTARPVFVRLAHPQRKPHDHAPDHSARKCDAPVRAE